MSLKMKINILITVIAVLGGCGQGKQSASESNKSQVAVAIVQDNFSSITTRLIDPAFGGVDGINGVTSPKPGSVIQIGGEKIEIAGNYVDAVKGEAAAGVVVMIDNKPFVAIYGGERPDIAKAHNNPKYLKSQFYAEVPISAVGKGIHDLKIRVIANDKSGYYESGLIAKLDIK